MATNGHFYRSAVNYDVDAASAATGYVETAESLTQQQFLMDSDINVMVRRYGITGVIPLARELAEYGDFSSLQDFQEAMEAVRHSDELFDSLPAAIRERFGNQTGRLLEFLHDPANEEEARNLGLLPKVVTPGESRVDAIVTGGRVEPGGNVVVPPAPSVAPS